MLLELHRLSQSLRTAGVSVEERDDHLVSYPNGKPLFRVTIEETGIIAAVSRIDKETAGVLLKYEASTGGSRESIPGFNVPPLFVPTDSATKSVADDIKQFVKRLKRAQSNETSTTRAATLDGVIAKCESGWSEKQAKIDKCLKNAVDSLVAAMSNADGQEKDELLPLSELLRRVKNVTPETLREGIIENARQRIIRGDASANELEGLLQMMFAKDASIILELADWGGVPANHQTIWQALNRVLTAGRRIRAAESSLGADSPANLLDSFGKPCPNTDEKMPERKLPQLGNVKLRSNAKSKACQTRYGLTEGGSCPVGTTTAAPLADALRWLTDLTLEGKTYRDITNSCGFDLRAILLAYPDRLPALPPALAAIFAKTGQLDSTAPDTKFVAAAELLVKQLEELKHSSRVPTVTIFVLAKRDAARTKLLLSRQFTASRIRDAVRDWQAAAANLPPVSILLFGDNRTPNWVSVDDVPYPSEVSRCLNRVWVRNGERMETVPAFEFGSVLTLLLDDGPLLASTAACALRLAVTNWADLLLAIGQAVSSRRVCTYSSVEQLLLPPILGLLLYKLGHRKEVYMNDTPYWIGRLLSVADRINKHYWDIEFDKKNVPLGRRRYPPQFLGNSSMAAALENPVSGMARVAERIALYKRSASPELIREAAEIEMHIKCDNLRDHATDEHKAQMLLGYLARPDLLQIPASTETKS